MCILERVDDICLYIVDTTTMRPRALLKKKNSNLSCRYTPRVLKAVEIYII